MLFGACEDGVVINLGVVALSGGPPVGLFVRCEVTAEILRVWVFGVIRRVSRMGIVVSWDFGWSLAIAARELRPSLRLNLLRSLIESSLDLMRD